MKLATLQDGSRDGQLVVVSRDLLTAHYASGIASHLQQVLDDWNFLAPQLQDLSDALNQGRARHAFALDTRLCMAPLPRAAHWADSLAYLPAQEVHGVAPGSAPVMQPGSSASFLAPHAPFVCASEALGIDFGAGLAVVSGDIPMACSPERALDGVRLLMLANAFTLHGPLAAERAAGFGLCQSKPAVAFSPVAVTPDELGDAWARGRLQLAVQSTWNGRKVGMCEAAEMQFHFGQLLAHLAQMRRLRAGTVVGSGPVSNAGVASKGSQTWPSGYSCIAHKRAMEQAQGGQAVTEFMKFGDTIRIEAKGKDGHSVFGAIEQEVAAPV